MAPPSARFRLLPTVLLLTTLISAPAFGQGEGQGMGGGAGMGRRGMGMGGGRPNFDPTVIDGPPAPDRVDSVMTLEPAQKDRYSTLYQNLMTSTKSERDQVAEARAAFRNGGGDADPEARQRSRDSMREAMQTLRDRQKSFDEALKDFLNKDQLKQYDEWRKARRKEMADRRSARGGRGPQGSPPQ